MKKIMDKKRSLFLLTGVFLIVFLTGCDYFTGPAGVDGMNGGNVPGGYLTVQADSLTPAAKVKIIFDPDIYMFDGNEVTAEFPLNYDIFGGFITWTYTWSAPDVLPGSYYIYYYIDADGSGDVNGPEQLNVYNPPSQYFSYDNQIIPWEIVNDGYVLPTYSFTSDFAPQLDLTASYTAG